ncbi:hypothetical protein [Maledivibacter halophilus]|uniref:Lipoprotein n=1 Tax=Maledivibacter halophilus TaxID=36842 RepID=A0A1T5MTI0_9FIRM|nr:hypothetical protein [Maledivibacter halophilus]SKC91540.1 hypothetical protein SAMN02194393_05338 [Maledivibacter halophilus]
MKKHLKKMILITSLALVLTACQADQENLSSTEENTETEIQSEEKINVGEEFEKLVSNEGEIEEIKDFVDSNIKNADKEIADKMVHYLIDKQNENLIEESKYFYNEDSRKIYDEVMKVYENMKEEFGENYVFAGENKYLLVDNMENEEISSHIKEIFDKGYGLITAEATFYPIIDYKIMKQNYGASVGDMTAEYFNIMANEIDEPTLVEEYLAVEVSKLKDRTFKYEEFLKKYPDSVFIDEIKMRYMECIWKLVNPNIFDGTLDQKFQVIDELKEVYKNILSDDSHPVTVEAVKGITEFIESKNGPLGSQDNMNAIFEVSDKLRKETENKIDELYLGE